MGPLLIQNQNLKGHAGDAQKQFNMILKHKGGNVPKAGNYNYSRLEQSYLTELMQQRTGSQSHLNQYENFLNVELNDQYKAHGLMINNQI